MTFFYDKPIHINKDISLYKTNSVSQSKGIAGEAVFRRSLEMSDTFGAISSPLDLSEKQIQELALKNPRIIEIIEKNKLWNY